MVQGEDGCTRRGWTFYRSDQSAAEALETTEAGIEMTAEAGVEVDKD